MRCVCRPILVFLLVALLPGLLLMVFPPWPARAAIEPICDVTCEPDPGSTGNDALLRSRPLPHNGRGGSSPFSPPAGGSAPPPQSSVIAGSESYNYAIPLLSLPGRNGLDLNLTLYYNSRVWTLDKVSNIAAFNADRDFPSYGFRLGFGFLEGPFTNQLDSQSYLLTEPDGSKRELRVKAGTTNLYQSVDSSYSEYDSTTKVLRRKDGTQWKYEQAGTSPIYRPTQIQDTNGNYISISYHTEASFKRYYSATVGDHWVTTGSVVSGYGLESTLGTLFGVSQSGTQPLYGCKVSSGSSHFISLQPNCEGQIFLRTEGWIFSSPPEGIPAQALYRCRAGSDHFVSTFSTCEGQTFEALLGYAKTAPPLSNQAINTITDTLGRVITFNYDGGGKLTSVTGPALGGGTKAYATFTWGQIPLNYNFSLAVSDSPANGATLNILTGCAYANSTGRNPIPMRTNLPEGPVRNRMAFQS